MGWGRGSRAKAPLPLPEAETRGRQTNESRRDGYDGNSWRGEKGFP